MKPPISNPSHNLLCSFQEILLCCPFNFSFSRFLIKNAAFFKNLNTVDRFPNPFCSHFLQLAAVHRLWSRSVSRITRAFSVPYQNFLPAYPFSSHHVMSSHHNPNCQTLSLRTWSHTKPTTQNCEFEKDIRCHVWVFSVACTSESLVGSRGGLRKNLRLSHQVVKSPQRLRQRNGTPAVRSRYSRFADTSKCRIPEKPSMLPQTVVIPIGRIRKRKLVVLCQITVENATTQQTTAKILPPSLPRDFENFRPCGD